MHDYIKLAISIALASTLCLSGCSVSYTSTLLNKSLSETGLKDSHRFSRSADWRLDPNLSTALKLVDPTDTALPRTTRQLNKALIAEFDKRFSQYGVVSSDTLRESLFEAFVSGHELLFVARLNGAENKLNTRHELQMGRDHYPQREWGRDTLTFQLAIYETQTQEMLDLIVLKSEAAYLKSNDTVALDLVDSSVKQLFDELIYAGRS